MAVRKLSRFSDPPGTEMVRGVVWRKMSPKLPHALLQARVSALLLPWAVERGFVAAEWDIDLTEPGAKPTRLRPDLAYASFARTRDAMRLNPDLPKVAPELAIEILSPSERTSRIETKIDLYRRAGTEVVLLVDPQHRTFTSFDAAGSRKWAQPEVFEHPALPGLRLPLGEVFAILDRLSGA